MSRFISFLHFLPRLFLILALVTPIYAQENPCDPTLVGKPGDPLGYSLRDDRCEGRYETDISTVMLVRSFTGFFEDYDLNSGDDLIIEWTSPPGQKQVWIRAQSLNPDLPFQMDTIRPPGNVTYHWPTDILSSLRIFRDALGVIAFTRYPVVGKDRDIVIPIQIKQKSTSAGSSAFRVVMVCGREITEVLVSLAPIETSGVLGNFIFKKKPLGYNFYPAEEPIEFLLPLLQHPGLYFLAIRATLKSGGPSDPIDLYFYNPKP
jgi:hypothetical protein